MAQYFELHLVISHFPNVTGKITDLVRLLIGVKGMIELTGLFEVQRAKPQSHHRDGLNPLSIPK